MLPHLNSTTPINYLTENLQPRLQKSPYELQIISYHHTTILCVNSTWHIFENTGKLTGSNV